MIEPLNFFPERAPTLAIKRPVYCGLCISKNKRNLSNLAVKYCTECEKYYMLCLECDEEAHGMGPNKYHIRRTIVIGPGVRKQILHRGDAHSYPLPLDNVEIKYKVRVFSNGKMIHKERTNTMKFMTGLSGNTIHVQLLGARNILAADLSGTSDPFVVGMYCGKQLGKTRVCPRTLNPDWKNETFVVPLDDFAQTPRSMPRSQKDMFRLELYDYDWFTKNDFLGHVEIPKAKLIQLCLASNMRPICLPLGIREFHGICGIQLGLTSKYVCIRVCRAESLMKGTKLGQSNPFAKVYFGKKMLGKTNTVYGTTEPEWSSSSVFYVKINDILQREKVLKRRKRNIDIMNGGQLFQSNINTASGSLNPRSRFGVSRDQPNSAFNNTFNSGFDDILRSQTETDALALFRIEIFHAQQVMSPRHLGTCRVTLEFLRKMLPDLPVTPLEERGILGIRTPALPSFSKTFKTSIRHMATLIHDYTGIEVLGNDDDFSDDDDDEDEEDLDTLYLSDDNNNNNRMRGLTGNLFESDDPLYDNIHNAVTALANSKFNYSPIPTSKATPSPKKTTRKDRLSQAFFASRSGSNSQLLLNSNSEGESFDLEDPALSPRNRPGFEVTSFSGKHQLNSLKISTDFDPSNLFSPMRSTKPASPSRTPPVHTPEEEFRLRSQGLFSSKSSGGLTGSPRDFPFTPRIDSLSKSISNNNIYPSSQPFPEDQGRFPVLNWDTSDNEKESADSSSVQIPNPDAAGSAAGIEADLQNNEVAQQWAQLYSQNLASEYPEAATADQEGSAGGTAYDGNSNEYASLDQSAHEQYDYPYENYQYNPEESMELTDSIVSATENAQSYTDMNSYESYEHHDAGGSHEESNFASSQTSYQNGLQDDVRENLELTQFVDENEPLLAKDVGSKSSDTLDRAKNAVSMLTSSIRNASSKLSRALVSGKFGSDQTGGGDKPGEQPGDSLAVTDEKPSSIGSLLRSTRVAVDSLKSILGMTKDSLRESKVVQTIANLVETEEIVWSKIRHFRVDMDSKKNYVGGKYLDRGYLILRLISSSRGNVIVGLDSAVQKMTLGEVASVKMRYDFCYGNFYAGSNIPPRANMIFTVQLLSINQSGTWSAFMVYCRRFGRVLGRIAQRIKKAYKEYHKRKPIVSFFKWLFTKKAPEITVENNDVGPVESPEESEYDTHTTVSQPNKNLVKIDPKHRKFITKAVLIGNKNLWGYKGPSPDQLASPKTPKKKRGKKKGDKSGKSKKSGSALSSGQGGLGTDGTQDDLNQSMDEFGQDSPGSPVPELPLFESKNQTIGTIKEENEDADDDYGDSYQVFVPLNDETQDDTVDDHRGNRGNSNSNMNSGSGGGGNNTFDDDDDDFGVKVTHHDLGSLNRMKSARLSREASSRALSDDLRSNSMSSLGSDRDRNENGTQGSQGKSRRGSGISSVSSIGSASAAGVKSSGTTTPAQKLSRGHSRRGSSLQRKNSTHESVQSRDSSGSKSTLQRKQSQSALRRVMSKQKSYRSDERKHQK